MSINTTVAILLHYYPSYNIERIFDLSYRQIEILLQKVDKINEMMWGSSGKDDNVDIESAKALGCKNPEALRK